MGGSSKATSGARLREPPPAQVRCPGVVHHGWKPSKLGHEIPVKAHTSEMTTEECSTFIEWLPIWA